LNSVEAFAAAETIFRKGEQGDSVMRIMAARLRRMNEWESAQAIK
jgi:hypothetical protein